MQIILTLFGQGKDLDLLQMCCRSILVFIICLVFVRISGRRSFGIRTPLDNIIVILLGALLSRAIVGASPFIPVVAASFVFVLFHRLLGLGIVSSPAFARLVEGKKIALFKDGSFLKDNMRKALVCEEDVMQGVRKSASTEDLGKIKEIYMERTGEISPIRKD